ncbi:RE1 [Symbiodinium sp. CCMP2592]|nr:RE1 [Symbiodinium sp. CCMP2592]
MSQLHGESFYGNLGQPLRPPVPDPPQEHSDGAHAVPGDVGGDRSSRDDQGGGSKWTPKESSSGAGDDKGQGGDDRWQWSRNQQSWWGYSWGNGSQWDSSWEPRWDSARRWSRDETWGTGSTESGSATDCQGNGNPKGHCQHGDGAQDLHPPRGSGDPRVDGAGGFPDGWRPTSLPAELGGPRPRGPQEGIRGPSEKMVVPTFSGTMDAGDENLGQTARSYLRQVAAWRRMTRMAPEAQALTLYQNLTGKAWIEAERLSVDRLAEADGVDHLLAWIKDRYLDVEITQVGRCLSDFFRKLRRKPGQSVRDYLSDFDRCLARLNEVGCVLPDLASAWVLVDRMGLEESAELNLLASVGNVYNLKLLKQASIVQDRSLRKPWETSTSTKPWNNRKPQSALMASALDEEAAGDLDEENAGAEDDSEVVPESVAAELYEAYVTHETARQKYRDTLKLRGNDAESMKQAMHQKLLAAKQRSFCSVCKKRGHWHRDPQCVFNQGQGKGHPGGNGSATGATSGSTTSASTPERNPKVNFPCHVVHVTWDLAQPAENCSLLGITDTACSRSVAGVPWIEAYMNEAKKVGFRPPFLEARESFKFGASRVFEAVYSVVLTFDIGGHGILVKVSVVNGDVPLLLSRPVLGRLGMVLDVSENKADFRKLNVKDLALVITETGHPAVPVKPIFVDGALAQGGGWDGPEVKILSERAQYTAFAVETVCFSEPNPLEQSARTTSPQSPQQSSTEPEQVVESSACPTRSSPRPSTQSLSGEPSVFHPKKLGSAVRGMLTADKLSPVAFMTWWNSTATSNDFWIEGEQVLIRIHVIPRKTLFNPGKWNTASPGHKAALLRALGSLRTTEAISCKTHREYHPIHGEWRDPGDDTVLPMLWVGRTVFSRARMSSTSDPLQFEGPHGIALHGSSADSSHGDSPEDPMGTDQGRVGEGSSSPRATAPSQVDRRGDQAVIQEDRTQRDGPSVPGAPPPSLSKMTLDQLMKAAADAHLEVPELMRVLRDNGSSDDTRLRTETPPSYRTWAIRETEANPGAQEDLKMFAVWSKRDLEAKQATPSPATLGGYLDSEDTATVPYTPDPSEQWDMVGMASPPSGARPKAEKENEGQHQGPQAPAAHNADPDPKVIQLPENTIGHYLNEDSADHEGEVKHYPEEIQSHENTIGHYLDEKDSADHEGVYLGNIPDALQEEESTTGVEDEFEAMYTGAALTEHPGGRDAKDTYESRTCEASGGDRTEGMKCEALARELLGKKSFSSESLVRLLDYLPMKRTRRHRGVCGEPTEVVKTFLGGMWTHGGLRGLSRQTQDFPWTIKYINKAMRELSKDAWRTSQAMWTSVLITQNVQTRLHKDVQNLSGSQVLTYTLGDFTGGNLWLEDPRVPTELAKDYYDEAGHAFRGASIDTKEKPYVFDPKSKHATEPWEGETNYENWAFPLRGLDGLLAPKPDHYDKADRPAKSVRKGIWKAAKRLVALTTVCAAAAATLTGAGRGLWSAISSVLPEDLYHEDFLPRLNETVEELAPATIWIHGDIAIGRLRELEEVAYKQIKKGRAVVWEAPDDASIWETSTLDRMREEGDLLLERSRNGRRELKINLVQTSVSFVGTEKVGALETYLASSQTTPTRSTTSEEACAVTEISEDTPSDRLHESRGASAITFEAGKKIPPVVQASLRRLHQNLAHPRNDDLVRHLRMAGSAPEVLEAAKRLRCEVCDRHHRAKSAKPSSLPSLLEFNQLVAVDAFSVYDAHKTRVEFLMVIDLGTGFCVARELEGHSGEALEKVFCDAWASTFGPPGTLILDLETGLQAGLARFSEWHGTWIRPIAAQAHYQQGSVERCIRTWKQLWEKVVDDKTIESDEAAMAATVINSAMNSLRRSSGTSPAQAVWGREPKLPEDLTLPAESEHFESVLTRDRLRAREFALRNSARTAYYKCQSDATLRRALHHRSRVAGPELVTGDHVYIYRKPKSQKHWEWYGPGVLIGREGPNWWVSYSGRCHLTSPEHLRMASGEELGAAFSLRATREDLERILDMDFSDETIYVDDTAMGDGDHVPEEILIDPGELPGDPSSPSATGDNKRDKGPSRLPPVTKRQRKKGPGDDPGPSRSSHEHHDSAFMAKFAKTARGREKALEKEIPWNLIPSEAKDLFKNAEAKQYQEHRDHGALEPLSLEESREIATTKADRILPSRFAYRDKNWSKRRGNPAIDWKAKARLVIGGHRDPDLLKGLNTHAPTISRQGILLLLQILASNLQHGWSGHAGDVTAAFLSGEELTRELFLKQPKCGLGGLHPEQLLRIRKPIFGLVDSPAAWWHKLSGTLKTLTIVDDQGVRWAIKQCELDNCIFTVHQVNTDENGYETYGKPQAYLGVHVDDILLIGNDGLCACLKRELSKQFPIDEWETGSFEYVGSYVDIQPDRIKVSQESYVSTRLFNVEVEKGAKDWEPASETQRLDNMSLIGALSWLASQSRPDLQVGVSMSQQCQRDPCIGDIRFTNLLAQRALEHQQEGVYIYPVDFEKALLICYHDAGWANCPQDQEDPFYALDEDEEKQGLIEGGPHGLLSKKAKKANSSIASQLGCLFMFGEDKVLRGHQTPMSILDWKSGACERVCRSTFQAETMACAYGIETSEYILKFLQTLLDGKLIKGNTKFPARFVSDCKSLYDHLMREGIPRVPTCKRLAIDLASIRCDLSHFGKIAWTPTTAQLADLLTKPLKAASWWDQIKSGIRLTFREEEKILNECKSKIDSESGASSLPCPA